MHLIEEPIAAAIGAGLAIAEPVGRMVIDVGGGTSEVAVISMGGIVLSRSVRVGGYDLDDAIAAYIRSEHVMAIGSQTAEAIKLAAGSAEALEEELVTSVRGRDLLSGLPREIELSSAEIRGALGAPLSEILTAIHATLEETPPELAGDIARDGILLAGGGALLRSFDDARRGGDGDARAAGRLAADLRRRRRRPRSRGARRVVARVAAPPALTSLPCRAMWLQREITLEPRPRGFRLVTREVERALPELGELEIGLCHLFIRHTSASLTLNENASPDVRRDLETWFNDAVPERFDWEHTIEGPDDMPAHVKASLLGPSLSLPVTRRSPGPRHLAGRLPLRAPRPRGRALTAGKRLGSVARRAVAHRAQLADVGGRPARRGGDQIGLDRGDGRLAVDEVDAGGAREWAGRDDPLELLVAEEQADAVVEQPARVPGCRRRPRAGISAGASARSSAWTDSEPGRKPSPGVGSGAPADVVTPP